MKIKRFVCNDLAENCYVVSSGDSCVIIDPGFATAETGAFPGEPFFGEHGNDAGAAGELSGLYKYLDSEGLTPEAILLTHSHSDHTLGVAPLVEKFGIPVYSATRSFQTPTDAFSCLRPAGEGVQAPEKGFSCLQVEDEGSVAGFKVIATPGHTPDSVCYYSEAEHVLFTGDTLFAGTIGRTDLPGGDYDSEIRSIMEKLIFLPGETEIYPGHGPSSTIARERAENPFLEPFNEREEIFPDEEK
jgi:glyoxylase-like metal-dependent hydrolase (beta-lactamase superfamily II)